MLCNICACTYLFTLTPSFTHFYSYDVWVVAKPFAIVFVVTPSADMGTARSAAMYLRMVRT